MVFPSSLLQTIIDLTYSLISYLPNNSLDPLAGSHYSSSSHSKGDHFFKTWAAIIITSFLLILRSHDNEAQTCIVNPFYFSPASIKALQSMARTHSLPNPTRLETVSAFLWNHLIAAALALASSASLEKESERKESVVIHSVNMRPCINPAAPADASGKFTTHAFVECNNIGNGSIASIAELSGMMRKAFSDAKDMKVVSKLIGEQGEEATRGHKQKIWELKHDPNKFTYTLTSWGVGLIWILGRECQFGLVSKFCTVDTCSR